MVPNKSTGVTDHHQSLNVDTGSPVSLRQNIGEIKAVSETKFDQLKSDVCNHVVEEKKYDDQPSFLDRFKMAADYFSQCKQLRSDQAKLNELITRQGQFMLSVFEEGNASEHALSQFHLAMMYQYGWHVAPDDRKAFSVMKKAAVSSDDAKLRLAYMLMQGAGCKPDHSAAARLFVGCADRGMKRAHYYAATVYKSGFYGYERSDEKAYHHFLVSAKNGDLRSQYFVAKQLFYGEGVAKNKDKAELWLDHAVMNGSNESELFKRMIVQNRLDSAIRYFRQQMSRVMHGAFFDDMRDCLLARRRFDKLVLAEESNGIGIGFGATSLVSVNKARFGEIEMELVSKVSKESLYNPKQNRISICSYPLLKELQFFSMMQKNNQGGCRPYSNYLVEFYGASLSDDYVLHLYLEKCQLNLLHYLQSENKTSTDIIRLSKDVLAAVKFLHEVGVVHRDVKLENILVAEGASGMRAKLCDFGTMFELDSSLDSFLVELDSEKVLHTTTNIYIAPEFLSQKNLQKLYKEHTKLMRCYALIYNSFYKNYTLIDHSLAKLGGLQNNEKKIFLRTLICGIDVFSTGLVLMEMFCYAFCVTNEALLTCLKCLKDCVSPIETRSFNVDTKTLFSLFSNTPMLQAANTQSVVELSNNPTSNH